MPYLCNTNSPSQFKGITQRNRSVNGLMAPKQFTNKKGGNTRHSVPLPFPCDNKKVTKPSRENLQASLGLFTLLDHQQYKFNSSSRIFRVKFV